MERHNLLQRATPRAVAGEPRRDGVEHVLITKGLRQEIDGTRLHGLDRHRNVAMPGHEYDRDLTIGPGKLGLKFQTAHAGQAHIQDDTGLDLRGFSLQERGRRVEELRLKTDRSEQCPERFPHRWIVVDHQHQGLTTAGGTRERTRCAHGKIPPLATAFPSAITAFRPAHCNDRTIFPHSTGYLKLKLSSVTPDG